ncbi:hypothetical protein LVJ94_51665 [Pendulispora rubella]|uniref:Carboxypeptidase regulatory-like domain-containing protein n=1 Tax=Pendulispora rubella TaxID=2741070 RepID=A0ABZ2L346_9BACT
MTSPTIFSRHLRGAICAFPFLLSFGAVWACSGSDGAIPIGDAGMPDARTPETDAGDGATYPTVTVTGKAVNQVGEGVPEARAIVVDAVGKKQEASAGKDGIFSISGIALPYDLSVTESGTVHAHLGLTRTDPQVDLFSTKTGRSYPLSRYADVSYEIPPIPGCPNDPSSPKYCVIQVGMSSPEGEVHHHDYYEYVQPGARLSVRYLWTTSAKRLTVKAHLLVQPDRGGPFYHSAGTMILDDEGRTTFVWPEVTMVPRAGAWTVSLPSGMDVPQGWRQERVIAWLNLPNGEGSVYLGSPERTPLPLTVEVPNLVGATMGASTHLSNTANDDGPKDREIRGVIDSVSLDASASPIPFERGEHIQSPAPGEPVSVAAGVLTWSTEGGPALYRLRPRTWDSVIDSNSNRVSLSRLSDLGVRMPYVSSVMKLSLITRRPFVSVDDMTGPSRSRIRENEYGTAPQTFTQASTTESEISITVPDR